MPKPKRISKEVTVTKNKNESIKQRRNSFTLITSSSSLISKMLGMKPATNSPIQSTADKRIYSKWILSLKLVSQRKKKEYVL